MGKTCFSKANHLAYRDRRHSNIKDAIVFVLKLPHLSICKMSSATFRISLIGQFSVDETCKGGRGADAALTDHFPTENGVKLKPENGHNV